MLFFTYGIRIINQYGLCMKAWASWDKCYAQVISAYLYRFHFK